MQISAKLRNWRDPETGREGLIYWCQGCNEAHRVITQGQGAWQWDGNTELPTFSPSVLVTWHSWDPPVGPDNIELWREAPWKQTKVDHVCHTFIRNGQVQFLGDCTHGLAGQSQPLPDLPPSMRDEDVS